MTVNPSICSERRRRGAVQIVVALAVAALLAPAALSAQPSATTALMGPIPLRIVSPLRLLFFQLTPEGAATLGKGDSVLGFDVSESNILHIRNIPATEFDAEINLEITRLNMRFNYGVSKNVELGLELPVYGFHSGFLDETVRTVENLVGDLKVQREFERTVPGADRFLFQLKKNGEIFFEQPGPRSGLGDLAITVKRRIQVQAGRRPALALRAALELPTGNEELAMGSGGVDLAVGVAADYAWSRWAVHGNLNATEPFSNPFRNAGLKTQSMLSGHVGVAHAISPNWVFHLQVAGTTAPFEAIKVKEPSPFAPEPFDNFGGSIIEGTFGASHALGRRSELRLALIEDFLGSANAASDVSLLVSVSLRLEG